MFTPVTCHHNWVERTSSVGWRAEDNCDLLCPVCVAEFALQVAIFRFREIFVRALRGLPLPIE